MKPRWGTWLAILMVVTMVLSACTTPQTTTPTAVPETGDNNYVVATDAAFPPMEFVDANKDIVGL